MDQFLDAATTASPRYRPHPRSLSTILFIGLVLLTGLYGVQVEGFEQSHGGTSCDDSCHDGHHDREYTGELRVSQVKLPETIRRGDEFQITLDLWNYCDADRFCRFRDVEVTLISQEELLDISNAQQTIFNLDEGESRGRSIQWQVEATNEGGDTLIFDLDGYNTHEGGISITTEATQDIEILPMIPDFALDVENVKFQPSAPINGQPVTADLTVLDLKETGTGDLRVYRDIVDEEYQVALVEDIQILAFNSIDLKLTMNTTGWEATTMLIFIVDKVQPGDSNPDNNRIEVPISVLPIRNVWVQSIYHSPRRPYFSETMEVEITLGSNASYPIISDLELILTNPFGNHSRTEMHQVTIIPGQETVKEVQWRLDNPSSTPGNSTFEVTIDPHFEIPEVSKDDNSMSHAVSINPWVPIVELQLRESGVELGPEPVIEGIPTLINVTVANLGRFNASSYLTVSVTDAGLDLEQLAVIPVSVVHQNETFVHLPWNTWGWAGNDTKLLFEVDELPDEDLYSNNKMTMEVLVLPPPQITTDRSSLSITPTNLSWLYPAEVAFEVSETNGTPLEGNISIRGPDGKVSGSDILFRGGDSQHLMVSIDPVPGIGLYQISYLSHGSSDRVEFELVAKDPQDFFAWENMLTSPGELHSGQPTTLLIGFEWGLNRSTNAKFMVNLVDVNANITIELPARNIMMHEGQNFIVWTTRLPTGNFTIFVDGALLSNGQVLNLSSQTYQISIPEVNELDENSPGPTLVMFFVGALVATILSFNRRKDILGTKV